MFTTNFSAMYSKWLVSESVRKSPAIDKLIDEFKSGIRLARKDFKLAGTLTTFLTVSLQ